nr:RING finger protein 215-like [Lytechinus pictus]
MKMKLKMKGLENEAGKLTTHYPNSPVKLRHIAKVIKSSKLASWAFVLSLLLQLVSGEREAIVRVQPGGIEVRGEYSRSGPSGLNASGLIQTITGTCSEDNDSEPNEFDKRKVNKDEKISEDEEWVGIFYLPPLEESAGAQSGTGCSLLEQVKQAMLFGASALLVLALNPGLFKEIELHFTSDRPIIVITDPKDIKKFRSTVDLRKNKQSANITSKPDPTAKMKPMLAPKLTLWSTCGRSSGGSKFREWEGTVCLSHHKSSSEHEYNWIWRTLVSLIITFYIVSMIRGMARHPQQNNIEDLEETLQRLAKQSLSKMSVWKYKRKRYQLSADSSESCAVCLEEFFKGQTIRMLPCHHTFHNRCVDSWLIRKRTCPLCKMDIIDERFGLGKR